MPQTTKSLLARTPLFIGGSPRVCKVWLQSQLEHDWLVWRGGLREYVISRKTPPSLALLAPPPLLVGENFKLLELQKAAS